MAHVDPQMLEMMLEAGQGKGGGRRERRQDYAEGLYSGDSRGPGGSGLDPRTEFDLHENDLAATDHFASLGNMGMGPNTSLAATFAGHRRAAAAESYNNRIRDTEAKLKLLGEAEKMGYRVGPGGQLEKETSGFEAGYNAPPASTPESGFNPQGAF
jgi:hypothetical protein